jgi:S1-C subfamily serine protease
MLCLLSSTLTGCLTAPAHTPHPLRAAALSKHVIERAALIVTLPEAQADGFMKSLRVPAAAEISLSTATPVSADGYFLTSAHSVRQQHAGDVSVIFYSPSKSNVRGRVHVVWKDEVLDLALVKAPFSTPLFYSWTPRDRTVPAGAVVVHGGVSTGPKGQIGELLKPVSGNGLIHAARHSLRLQPGDSGGPLLLTSGELVGINRAVAYQGVLDTTFFTESQSVRPDPARIASLIRKSSSQL